MAQRYQGGILGVGFNPLQAPNAPTIGTATSPSGTTASVAFTAPANVGGSPITSYAVQSTPGGIGATGTSSPITVSGLTTGTAYTFRVTALNSYGPSPASASSNSVTPVVQGQQAYTTPGTYSWVAPAGVTSVSVVAVGGGSAGGGGLGYKNNYPVTPGSSYAVVVGAEATTPNGTAGSSHFVSTAVVRGGGSASNAGGTFTGDGGGNGGANYGGGAGGYAGNGGTTPGSGGASAGTAGAGGGGGGAGRGDNGSDTWIGGGGGVGILGQGANGAAGTSGGGGGGGGSSGTNGTSATSGGTGANAGNGGAYGGGRGATFEAYGIASGGAVRIIWPGTTRSFPSTNTGNL